MTAADTAKSRWWHDPANQHVVRAVGAAVPVACVNATAFIGQFSFVHDHVRWILAGQVLFAGTLETVAVYLAWQAHLAKKARDTSLRLTMGAYLFAAVVGAMNYSHFANHWHPTFMAVAMAAMSVMSPALWGVHTRRVSRDELKAEGLIEDHAVRLGGTRWTWHPVRSMRVMNWATWHGINNPKRAIANFAGRYGVPADLFQDLARSLAREERAMLAQILLAQNEDVPVAVPSAGTEIVPAGDTVPAADGTAPFLVPPPPVTTAARPVENPVAQQHLDNGTGVLVSGPDGRPQAVMVLNEDERPVLNGEAHLEADANLGGGRPSQEVIDQAELTLMATPLDKLPSVRAVARDLLGDPNQRRLAAKLLKARTDAGTSFTGDPKGSADGNQVPGMIAPVRGFQPGGANG